MPPRKRPRLSRKAAAPRHDLFDQLPDDLLVLILSKLSSSASCPSDFVSVLLTCKRLNSLALHPLVLSKAGAGALSVKAASWSDSAYRFLNHCVTAGNAEACYVLGMIRFYCLGNKVGGASLMAKAAMKCHAPALYSLAVIQFNGSGGTKNDKDLRAGVALCARAAFLGHVDALRELGHCLQDGYGVSRNVVEGRRFLIQANARELLAYSLAMTWQQLGQHDLANLYACSLFSDFGCNVPTRMVHPVNRFMIEWFGSRCKQIGCTLRTCSYSGCGRPETRSHEFRRCSVCGLVNYCSRACQALDWKVRHKADCVPMEQWLGYVGQENGGVEDERDVDDIGGEIEEVEDEAGMDVAIED